MAHTVLNLGEAKTMAIWQRGPGAVAGANPKKVKRSESNIFDRYTVNELNEFKEGFIYMDFDQDGILTKKDLRSSWDSTGKEGDEDDMDLMLGEASGPVNFTQLLSLFYNKMLAAGDTGDDDDAITHAFRVFEDRDGTIEKEKFRELLMSGNLNLRFTEKEVDIAFGEMEIIDGRVNSRLLCELITGSNLDEEIEEEEEEEEEQEEDEGGD